MVKPEVRIVQGGGSVLKADGRREEEACGSHDLISPDRDAHGVFLLG
jgi:hypothetical protein